MFRSRRLLEKLFAYPLGVLKYRVKVPIPGEGECWFTFDNPQLMEDVLKEISQESPHLSLRTRHPRVPFKDALDTSRCDIIINNKPYNIVKSYETTLEDKGNNLDTFVDYIIKIKPESPEELKTTIEASLKLLGEKSESLMGDLKTSLSEVAEEINKIEAVNESIEKRARRVSNLWGTLGLAFLVGQWGAFYYAIYSVDWLGWDLMEPITYSVGQGTFVFGLYYYLRTRKDHTYENMFSRYEDRWKEKKFIESGVEIGRYQQLLEEQESLKSKLEMIERKLNY